jgi:hypothetical protein
MAPNYFQKLKHSRKEVVFMTERKVKSNPRRRIDIGETEDSFKNNTGRA